MLLLYLYFKLDRHCTLKGWKHRLAPSRVLFPQAVHHISAAQCHSLCPPVWDASTQLQQVILSCHLMARKQPGTSKWHKEYVPATHLVKPYRNTQSLLAVYALLTYFSHFQLKCTNKLKFYDALASHKSIHHLFANSKKKSPAVFPLDQYFIGKARWSEEQFLHLSEALPANAWLLCHIKGAAA